MVFNIFKNMGRYPAEYNPKVHGTYDPSVFYGKKDTPLAEVKIGDLGSWLARKNKSPSAITSAISRAYWRWQFKFMQPKKAGIAPYIQLVFGTMMIFYVINYEHIRYHKQVKHHW